MRPSCHGNFKSLFYENDESVDCETCDYWMSCQTKTIKLNDEEEKKVSKARTEENPPKRKVLMNYYNDLERLATDKETHEKHTDAEYTVEYDKRIGMHGLYKMET